MQKVGILCCISKDNFVHWNFGG